MSDYITFDNRGKLRRKAKKELLGTLMSKTRLRKLLDSVQIIENKYPDESTILPYPFCPKCGCKETRSTGNMAEYPERWDRVKCARCNFIVAESDNSPYVHALECKENNYRIDL